MARIEKEVTMVKESSYERKSFSGYGYETVNIYKLSDGETTYVWKTTSSLVYEVVNENDDVEMYFPKRGDIIRIRATVKGESEYNGEKQTEINRVKVVGVVLKYKEMRYAEQMESLQDGDYIWHNMPYKQYKSNYSDCEIVVDSFTRYDDKPSTVDVIIRVGRLKNSGTRGERFAYYLLESDDGRLQTYKAVCEDNAIKRAEKERGGNWCVKNVTDCYRGGWRDIWR